MTGVRDDISGSPSSFRFSCPHRLARRTTARPPPPDHLAVPPLGNLAPSHLSQTRQCPPAPFQVGARKKFKIHAPPQFELGYGFWNTEQLQGRGKMTCLGRENVIGSQLTLVTIFALMEGIIFFSKPGHTIFLTTKAPFVKIHKSLVFFLVPSISPFLPFLRFGSLCMPREIQRNRFAEFYFDLTDTQVWTLIMNLNTGSKIPSRS